MENNNLKERPEESQSRIQIKSKDEKHIKFRKNLIKLLSVILLVGLGSTLTLLLMKNYVDRSLDEGRGALFADNLVHDQLIRIVNQGHIYNQTVDGVLTNLVGVAEKPEDFYLTDYRKSVTGVLLDDKGNIAVASDLVGNLKEVYVKFVTDAADKTTRAQVIGRDDYTGITIINTKTEHRAVLKPVEKSNVVLGENVLIVGSPFGTRDGINLTIGNIHSRNSLLETEGVENTSQIKTIFVASPVYGGNDGGLCITVGGEYIGLVNEKLSSLIGHNNLSAVIPHDELKTISDKITKNLSKTTYSMGVTGRTIYYEPLRKSVYYILGVNEGSTAHRGGLLPTDIILKIDGRDVNPNDNIDVPLMGKKLGDTITVEIYRMDKTMKLTMKVY